MVFGEVTADMPQELATQIEDVIRTKGGILGPGCCVMYANVPPFGWSRLSLSNCGDRATCDLAVQELHGEFVNYTQGTNCPKTAG